MHIFVNKGAVKFVIALNPQYVITYSIQFSVDALEKALEFKRGRKLKIRLRNNSFFLGLIVNLCLNFNSI